MNLARNAAKKCTELPFTIGSPIALPPSRVNFTLSYACNLNCRHCLQRIENRNVKGSGVSELTAREIAAVIGQTIPGLTQIGFCGGEIFLRSDIMEILSSAARRNPIGFATNGTRIDNDRAREIVRIGPKTVLFSIDGTEEEHDSIRGVPGTFRKAMESIRLLDYWKKSLGKKDPELSINIVISGTKTPSLCELAELAHRIGVRELGVQMVDMQRYRFTTAPDIKAVCGPPPPVESMPENLAEEIRNLIRRAANLDVSVRLKPDSDPDSFAAYYENRMNLSGYYCSFPWKNLIVSPCGDVYPCYMISMGNVRQNKLNKIWNGARFRDFRRAILKSRLLPGCAGCCFMSRD